MSIKNELQAIQNLWFAKTQKTIPEEIENSFCYWRASIKKARWIAGFGEMGWLTNPD